MAPRSIEIQSPAGEARIPLARSPITIGRHSTNALVVSDTLASRFHCVIEPSVEQIVIKDLNSRNGTRLNGQRLVGESPLFDRDLVEIGEWKLTVHAPGLERPEAPADDLLTEDDLVAVDEPAGGDEVETLDENDVVDTSPMLGNDDVIHIEQDHAGATSAGDAAVESDDPEAKLARTLSSNAEDGCVETDIALVNTRGQIMHPAGKPRAQKREAVDIFRMLLLLCLRTRATDLHFEPRSGQWNVRVRVDGVMVDVVQMPMALGTRIGALVKVLSDIDIAQRNDIQEGHFSANCPIIKNGKRGPSHRVDYRVSFAPAVHGQKLVIRVLDTTNAPLQIGDLQLPAPMLKTLSEAINQESGMILVCGPTGSGKTTSLYAMLRSINIQQLNVMTIEDPVEIEIEGVTQIPVAESAGKSFSALLRSMLRQDPDAIMVGEVRDSETARIAMQASITGHLVFSTLHTKDSLGTIFRLLDLGIEPYLIAQGLHQVLAQRLVRQLCVHCKRPVKPTRQQSDKLSRTVGMVRQLFEPVGCPRCLGTGFAGRRAFFELLSVTDALRDVILKTPTLEALRETLLDSRFLSLEHVGHQLVADGIVSFDEIDRAVLK